MKVRVKKGKSICCYRKEFVEGSIISSDIYPENGEKECQYLVDKGFCELIEEEPKKVETPEASKAPETPETPEQPKKRGRKKKGEK